VNHKPKCIIICGRPGSGKTTLAGQLSQRLYLPKISRDEIKEGYVNTFGIKHDQLPKDTNGIVNEVFFATTLQFLQNNVSLIIEAAFQHGNWNLVVPNIIKVAQVIIVICDLDAEASAKRHLERGLKDSNREFFHGDKRVSIYKETGKFSAGGPFNAPNYEVPTLRISTLNGYDPSLDKIVEFIKDPPNKESYK